jgi:uncharacterized protein
MQQPTHPEVRNLKFELGPSVPRFWHGERKSLTLFFNSLSIFFPPGERFFITSVKAFRKRIHDPVLAADAKAFYAQEAIHSREHVRYNDMLREQGYPVDAMERRIERILRVVTALVPIRLQLAATCALEHFTALMAHLLLNDTRLLEGADPTMAALWKWHAAEENEHKAVAFDVFRTIGGSYFERVVVMLFATVIFWAKVLEQQVRLMWMEGILFSLGEWSALFGFLLVRPGGMLGLVPMYLDYFRPRFHPWELDNQGLLDAWKQELAGSEAYAGVSGSAAEG